MTNADGITYKTVAKASCGVITVMLLGWLAWMSVIVVQVSDNEEEMQKLQQMVDQNALSFDGKIASLWRNGIAPLRAYHMKNPPVGPMFPVEDGHKD